jgi:hypothetical protein
MVVVEELLERGVADDGCILVLQGRRGEQRGHAQRGQGKCRKQRK